jgi:hypothetical protein
VGLRWTGMCLLQQIGNFSLFSVENPCSHTAGTFSGSPRCSLEIQKEFQAAAGWIGGEEKTGCVRAGC